MTEVWVTIAALTAATVAIKAVGPVTLGGRPLPPRLAQVVGLLAPALLGALVLVQTFSRERDLVVDERAIGVAAAAGAYALRGSMLLAVIVAPVATAAARQLL